MKLNVNDVLMPKEFLSFYSKRCWVELQDNENYVIDDIKGDKVHLRTYGDLSDKKFRIKLSLLMRAINDGKLYKAMADPSREYIMDVVIDRKYSDFFRLTMKRFDISKKVDYRDIEILYEEYRCSIAGYNQSWENNNDNENSES